MPEHIEREAVEKAILTKQEQERQHWVEYLKQFRTTKEYSAKEQAVDNWLRGYGEAVENLLAIFEESSAADVAEVKHGQWSERPSRLGDTLTIYSCSVCDRSFTFRPDYDFCPGCGADMRKREGAEE